MKRAAALFSAILLYGAIAWSAALPPNHSQVGIVMFTFANGAQPTEGVYYSLNETVPIQKVEGGYLIVAMDSDGSAELRPVFVRTKAELQQGQMLSGWAKCVGTVEYETLNGFKNTVPAFIAWEPRP